jgi:hypothetical protein
MATSTGRHGRLMSSRRRRPPNTNRRCTAAPPSRPARAAASDRTITGWCSPAGNSTWPCFLSHPGAPAAASSGGAPSLWRSSSKEILLRRPLLSSSAAGRAGGLRFLRRRRRRTRIQKLLALGLHGLPALELLPLSVSDLSERHRCGWTVIYLLWPVLLLTFQLVYCCALKMIWDPGTVL